MLRRNSGKISGLLILGFLAAVVAAVLMASGSAAAHAAVWTDQTDYSPGSVVTISGDNSDGAGYQPGETVDVAVNGPGAITKACSATADSSGAWSCQITLGTGSAAVGSYTYTATGETSAVSEQGTFTDSACPNKAGSRPTDPLVSASYSTSGGTATYSIDTTNESSANGIPGLIEYCVYTSPLPNTEQALYSDWIQGASTNFFDFERSGGDPDNLPFDGNTQLVGTATWSGSVPTMQTILLHINDPSECHALYGAGSSDTCFVLPGPPLVHRADLTVTKTANPSFTRTFTWGITKSVDQTRINIADGGSATFNYAVNVTHDSGTDSNWQVAGEITVTNPNGVNFNGVDVTDAIDNGGSCSVQGGGLNVTVPAHSIVSLDYTCTFTSAPASGTNTATATWDANNYGTPDGTASGTATYDFSKATPTLVDGTVTVTDPLGGGTLGTVSYTDSNPKTFTYSKTFSHDAAGTCTTHDNTATVVETGQTASKTVKVCVGADLTVSKDATPSFTRTFTWGIRKNVDKTEIDIAQGGSATFNYTVDVTHNAGVDSAWQVDGTITVSNPNNWEAITADVADSITNGGDCTVTGGTGVSIPAGQSVQLPYTCTYASAPAPLTGATNTAMATWDNASFDTPNGSAKGTAAVDFGAPTTIVDGHVTVTDTLGGTLGAVYYTDPSPTTFTYSKDFSGDTAGTCTTHDNTATFTTNTTSTKGSDSKTVSVCVGADLTVSKTADSSFTRTFAWGISKNVNKTKIDIAKGGSAEFTYTVDVTHDAGTDSDWAVNGTITVTNPNDWEAITANVADAVDNGGDCTLTGASTVTVPASGSQTVPYSCTYSAAPTKVKGTNTATATWDKSKFSTPSDSATGTASVDFSTPTKIVDGTVTVSDTLGGTLGTVTYTDPSPTSFTYKHTFSGDPEGTCTTHDNTATFTTDTGKTDSASQEVKVCVGADLTVGKTALPTFTRKYNWQISKSVDKTVLDPGGTATYTVTVTETGFKDSLWQVTGTITVFNPNDWESITANVTDKIDNGGSCVVTGGTGVPVLASSSVQLPYTCTYSAAPTKINGTNTATASWDAAAFFTPDASATGTAGVDFSTPTTTVNKTVTVTDSQAGTLGTATAVDTMPYTTKTFTYTKKFSPPTSGCVTVNNTATIVETGGTSSQSVKVCNSGALTMGFWQNKNGQAIITNSGPATGTCALTTWLEQYAPFQDLPTTSTCKQVAAYVYNIIKLANASGSSMNAMLKAQMLATSLDVYFSDPALGGNKISATAPIGGLTIDLTHICHMIDSSSGTATCSGTYENAGSAFGGAASLSVSQMLSYAASQSNVGGSIWYGQNKATQGLAKDAFDAINNQVATSP